jgi:tripeptidyl-peptidase-1
MLFPQLALVLATGFTIEAAATPFRGEHGTALQNREVPASHVLHERQMSHWAHTWQKRQRLPRTAMLPMRIGLKQSNLDHAHNMLMEM